MTYEEPVAKLWLCLRRGLTRRPSGVECHRRGRVGATTGQEEVIAIGLIFEGNGVTQEQYEQVLAQACPGNQPPPGMLYHAAGVGENGIIVIDIWESPASMHAFETEKLKQARQAAHITSHEVTIFPLINIMQP
jgi:hypothetical protein